MIGNRDRDVCLFVEIDFLRVCDSKPECSCDVDVLGLHADESGVGIHTSDGEWVHAHEEDSESELVFRPASYSLPPSRGRSTLDLRADGSYSESSPGPTDRPEQATGTWALEQDRLTLRPQQGRRRLLQITAAEPDRLALRRLPE